MSTLPLPVVAIVPPRNETSRTQVVIEARDRIWAVWMEIPIQDYDTLARDALIQAWWNNQSCWGEVDPDPCDVCGHYLPLCVLCGEEARHFWEIDERQRFAPLCDGCVAPYLDEPPGVGEIGMYACCEGCHCDTW